MNTDLAAQLARADFASRYPVSIIDFRWFGGTVEYGYTLWASALMAHLGTKVTGALAAVIGTWYTTRLLHRLRPARPVLGGIAAAVTQVANVVEGRITFACGLACGLIAITLLTTTRVPRWLAVSLAALFSLLCGGASPVAGAAALGRRRGGAAAAPARWPAAVLIVPSGDRGGDHLGRLRRRRPSAVHLPGLPEVADWRWRSCWPPCPGAASRSGSAPASACVMVLPAFAAAHPGRVELDPARACCSRCRSRPRSSTGAPGR